MSMMDKKLRKLTETFSTRLMELADVLPRGMEGQAVSIELRNAVAALEAAYRAAVASRTPEEYRRRVGPLRHGAAECLRWMQLINTARLVQSPRLDELLVEGQGILALLEAQRSASAPVVIRRRAEPVRRARPVRSARPTRPSSADVAA